MKRLQYAMLVTIPMLLAANTASAEPYRWCVYTGRRWVYYVWGIE